MCNDGQNILSFFQISVQFPFTTKDTNFIIFTSNHYTTSLVSFQPN